MSQENEAREKNYAHYAISAEEALAFRGPLHIGDLQLKEDYPVYFSLIKKINQFKKVMKLIIGDKVMNGVSPYAIQNNGVAETPCDYVLTFCLMDQNQWDKALSLDEIDATHCVVNTSQAHNLISIRIDTTGKPTKNIEIRISGKIIATSFFTDITGRQHPCSWHYFIADTPDVYNCLSDLIAQVIAMSEHDLIPLSK